MVFTKRFASDSLNQLAALRVIRACGNDAKTAFEYIKENAGRFSASTPAVLVADAAPCFLWNDKSAKHISTERPKSAAAEKDAELRELAAEVFRDSGGTLRYSELKKRIKNHGYSADSTADSKMKKMMAMDIISKTEDGVYSLIATPNPEQPRFHLESGCGP